MEKAVRFICMIPVLFFMFGCHPVSDIDKPNGWYHLSEDAENIEGDPIVTVKDFLFLRLDSGMLNNTNKYLYEITGIIKKEKRKTFADATEKSIGRKIGFFYNGKILCAPSPNMRLENGAFSVSLSGYDQTEAYMIYKELREEMTGYLDSGSSLTAEEMHRFDSLYIAWKNNYRTNPITQVSSNTNDARQLEQYPQLLEMGKKIIPCIITRLPVRNDFFALTLYDDLQDIDSLKCFDYSKGEQYRVQMTLKKYIEAKTGKKKKEFSSDIEKIQAIKELSAKYGGEDDPAYTDAERDSIFLDTDYEIMEDILKMFSSGLNE